MSSSGRERALAARHRRRTAAEPWWPRSARHREVTGVTERCCSGIDEGTTGVKAVLFDERPAAGARGAPRQGQPPPAARAGSSRTARRCWPRWWRRSAELLADAPGEVVACGLDHQGESVLAWDAETGEPLTPIVVWQDKRSQEVLDRLGRARGRGQASAAACRSTPTSPRRSWPGCSSTTRRCARAREAGTLRMGTVDSFLCDRLGAGFATDPSTASRTQLHALGTPGFDPLAVRALRGAARGAARGPRHRRRPGHAAPPEPGRVELPLRGAARGPAGGAGRRGLRGARVGSRPRTAPGSSCSPTSGDEVPEPAGGLLPTVAWSIDGRVEYALDGGVFAAGRDARVAVPRAGPGAGPAGAGRAGARGRRTAAGARVLPGAGRARRAVVEAGRPRGARRASTAAPRRAHVARAALEGIAWRVADVVAAIRETVEVRSPARRRRPHQRAAAARSSRPTRSARPVEAARRRRHGARGGRAGRGGRRACSTRSRRRPSCCRSTAGSSRSATTPGAGASTSAGAPS